ncbi:MipA/OmpV family protein [Paraurantiacibacter namhicola]|uniref:MltA-interacting protein MipA n=1 Tax=Paraurantiacibacter namhicola TaxID=645517 RepID=A0A1C7D6Y7_9SPHN|nr:MipA/OmpV family protein [Paraurantiacibacter namhicola]ANU07244.1 MltA-interacting protein MipA [Paraurantiacibacter namhicola]
MKFPKYLAALAASSILAAASPAMAQEETTRLEPNDPMAESVFNGDYLTVGVGVGYVPDYDGADEYVIFPLPVIQGSIGGIDINPRPGGLAVDFVQDTRGQTSFDAGVTARVRGNRTGDLDDPVVASLGELDTAIEVGPTVGVSFPALLNPFDSLSASVDVRWDVAGAHKGRVIDPSISYFTPLSRGIAASLSLSASFVDDDYASYYYDVTPADAITSGLPVFDADGGLHKAGVNLLVGVDLDGDVTNGGLALVFIVGYSRMLGDAKDTPFTSVRGSADQWLGAVGLAYTF